MIQLIVKEPPNLAASMAPVIGFDSPFNDYQQDDIQLHEGPISP